MIIRCPVRKFRPYLHSRFISSSFVRNSLLPISPHNHHVYFQPQFFSYLASNTDTTATFPQTIIQNAAPMIHEHEHVIQSNRCKDERTSKQACPFHESFQYQNMPNNNSLPIGIRVECMHNFAEFFTPFA